MQTLTTMSPEAASAAAAGGFFAALGIFAIFLIILGIAISILELIANWKIFTKAGEPGWKILIPVYNLYISFKRFWTRRWFWITFAVSVGSAVVVALITAITNDANSTIASVVNLCASVFELVVAIDLTHRISKSFGHGVGFTLGLIFLSPIFTCILGFNKDKYKKLPDVEA